MATRRERQQGQEMRGLKVTSSNRFIRTVFLSTTALIAAPALAAAADLAVKAPPVAEYRPWYIEIEGGGAAFQPIHADPGVFEGCPPQNCAGGSYTERLDVAGGPVIGGRFGYQFSPVFRADLSLQWMSATIAGHIDFNSTLINNACNPATSPGNCSLNATKWASALVGLVNGYFDFASTGHWRPYLTAGIGAAGDHLSSNCVSCDFGVRGAARTTTQFAWDVGVGARIDVFSDLKLDVAYRFYDLGKFRGGLNNNFDFNGNALTGNDSFTLLVHTVTLGVVYPF
jgi:opacity protein-like surface antigen